MKKPNRLSYRNNVALFEVQLWVLVTLHKLLLIWVQLVLHS